MSDDEFDNIPDDFADVQDVDWGNILAGPASVPTTQFLSFPETQDIPNLSNMPSVPSTASSSDYFSDEDSMDSAFLAELDLVERRTARASQAPVAQSSSVTRGNITLEFL